MNLLIILSLFKDIVENAISFMNNADSVIFKCYNITIYANLSTEFWFIIYKYLWTWYVRLMTFDMLYCKTLMKSNEKRFVRHIFQIYTYFSIFYTMFYYDKVYITRYFMIDFIMQHFSMAKYIKYTK